MINIVLLTGFLGAGKTTLMKQILEEYKDSKIGLIVNEFGQINIDGELLKKEGIQMAELSNGSIFCACIKDNFLASLIEMSNLDLSYIFIEASGLADPSNMGEILNAIYPKTKNKYHYRGAIAIIDCETFIDLSDLLPALSYQIEYSSFAVLNKADLVNAEIVLEVSEKVSEINPEILTYVTSYAKCNIKDMVAELRPLNKLARDSSNTFESRPKTFILSGTELVSELNLEKFLEAIAKDSFRMKGFVKTDSGNKEISAVGRHIHISDWNENILESRLVVISAVGIKMMSIITSAASEHLEGKLHV